MRVMNRMSALRSRGQSDSQLFLPHEDTTRSYQSATGLSPEPLPPGALIPDMQPPER